MKTRLYAVGNGLPGFNFIVKAVVSGTEENHRQHALMFTLKEARAFVKENAPHLKVFKLQEVKCSRKNSTKS